jgi:hypothetical protein
MADMARFKSINQPTELSPGSWEAKGSRGYDWPNLNGSRDYHPLEQEIARFSVKDLDGNVAYRDVILQAAEVGCSGTGYQELNPDDIAENKDLSCITDGHINSTGEVIVGGGMTLYLSAPGVSLNGG